MKESLREYTFENKELEIGLKEFYFNDILNPRDYILYIDIDNENIESLATSESIMISTMENINIFYFSDKKCNTLGDLWENEDLENYLSKEELEEIESFDDEFSKRERLWDKVLTKDSFKKDFFEWLNLDERIELLEEHYQNSLIEIEQKKEYENQLKEIEFEEIEVEEEMEM